MRRYRAAWLLFVASRAAFGVAAAFLRSPISAFVVSCCLGWSASALAEQQRLALVIGNAAYAQAPLRNPVNDARDVAAMLRTLDFEVIEAVNAGTAKMQLAVLEFAERLPGSSTGLFYYAGHGIQVDGRNYLIPVGADFSTELGVKFSSLDVGLVLDGMGRSEGRTNIVILDACRNNPFERRLRGASRGLAAIDAAQGTFIAYATAPGSVAADGTGRNGLYTAEFLKALAVPGLKVEEVFKRVRVGVSRRSGGVQIPWDSSSLVGDFVFNGESGVAQSGGVASAEVAFWNSIQGSGNAADYEAYLAQFPSGIFVSLARNRIGDVERRQSAQQLAFAAQPTTIEDLKKRKQRLEQEVQQAAQKAAPSPPYKIAIFPMGMQNSDSSSDRALERGVVKSLTKYIHRHDLLELTYSYYSDPREEVPAEEVWNGSKKEPILDAVVAHAIEHGAHGVVMGSMAYGGRSDTSWKLSLYVIDVGQLRIIKSKGRSDTPVKVAEKSFSDFIAGIRVASQAP